MNDMMDELYGIHTVLAPSSASCAPSSTNAAYYNSNVFRVGIDGGDDDDDHHHHQSGMMMIINGCGDDPLQSHHHHHHHHRHGGMMMSSPDDVKAQIANHPLYPNLVSAYIQCRKVAAPPEMSTLLEEISHHPAAATTTTATADEIGGDPELDEFMESYCEAMYKFKEELSKPFDEAKAFLSSIESQLSTLSKDSSFNSSYHSCGGGGGDTSEEEEEEEEEDYVMSYGEMEVGEKSKQQDFPPHHLNLKNNNNNNSSCKVDNGGDDGQQRGQVKEMLMLKYSGYLSSLRKDFLRKRKKGKLPKDARLVLLQWWDSHYRWPYPTEEEKNKLCGMTGLDQKQINNWFINQRKRHWRPSEDTHFGLMEGLNNNTSNNNINNIT